ncbi:ring-cleaving dioxygenase [Streptococcus bovimastitidis]|uniref:Ring-cleaving dioxygenase n=1 Tax=Streptococcus bovimastitidis TaxID=1856638 RepID=A0A1L8MM85_9STRE|nr:VOC family protein [Streptococcus bovimastitidis]OJF71846.1 ring-cleaving dioxygenase [Streptococcus bovimastitidis]
MENINRIHHISAIVGNAQENLDFYSQVLNLRLVKQTVNFDDPSGYHLYFTSQNLSAPSLMTFFPLENGQAGTKGSGQGGRILFQIPKASLDFWSHRLKSFGIPYQERSLFEASALFFEDPHQLELALVEGPDVASTPEIAGFHGTYMLSADYQASYQFLINEFGLLPIEENEDFYHLKTTRLEADHIYLPKVNYDRGQMGIGTVHHIAWAVENQEVLKQNRDYLASIGQNVTVIRNRKYFKSIYFREPGKVIFELATDGPGITIDEPFDQLGQKLQLPDKYENRRHQIETSLTPLRIPER